MSLLGGVVAVWSCDFERGEGEGTTLIGTSYSPFFFPHLRYCHVLVKLCQLINRCRFLGRAALGRVFFHRCHELRWSRVDLLTRY